MTAADKQIIIIGAGIGGLTTGALLLKAGHRVTILEAHNAPGGSAATFYYQKYRFDAGATLAGGFSPGEPHTRLAEMLGLSWPVRPIDPAWLVHLPDGQTVTQWSDRQKWQDEWQRVFPDSEQFWSTQEQLANFSWELSSKPFPWPPQKPEELWSLARTFRPSFLPALRYLNQSVADLGLGNDPFFRAFLDSQLIISAQTTSNKANALYGSAALDLPRRGVNHVRGGMGALATTLADWFRNNGGELYFRQKVNSIELKDNRAAAVTTHKGLRVTGDKVVANLTPWALADLLGEAAPKTLKHEVANRPATWGAFTLYLGLDDRKLPPLTANHHQVLMDPGKPLGEGNSVFISLAKNEDGDRAPVGKRPATLSTHTAVDPWWRLYHKDRQAYLDRRDAYMDRLLAAAERAVPGISTAVTLSLPGTPVTFESFTHRSRGMVGGFPQTSLWAARGPRTGVKGLWLVGDSIFPGQSTAGVTLGAMRVVTDVLGELRPRTYFLPVSISPQTVRP